MKKIKVFFIDLDGTLLDVKTKVGYDISIKNKEAMKKIEKKGIHIVISTGRSGVQAKKYLDQIDYDYAVTGNGSVILKKDKIIKSIKIDLKQSMLLIDFAKKHGLVFKVDDNREGYGAFSFLQKFITKNRRFIPLPHFNLDLHKKYYKMVFWGKSRRKISKLRDLMEKQFSGVSLVLSSKGWIIEVTNKEATKGLANLYVANLLGIHNKYEMAHIGDSMNDYTVLGKMRLIAMKNSSKQLLKKADFIGPSYRNSGVSKILNGEYKKNS